MESALFSPGDRSILPHTPLTARARAGIGMGPGRSSGLRYGSSEAAGWRGAMEDRLLIRCPMPGMRDFGLFCVLDGHGGPHSATFLAAELPSVLLQTVIEAQTQGRWDDADPGVQLRGIEPLLRQTLMAADRKLRDDPHMRVVVVEGSGAGQGQGTADAKKYVTQDKSGSTAVLCLVSSRLLAVANVGDSRAVLAQWAGEAGDKGEGEGTGVLAMAVTQDHKLSTEAERLRAERAGGMYVHFSIAAAICKTPVLCCRH